MSATVEDKNRLLSFVAGKLGGGVTCCVAGKPQLTTISICSHCGVQNWRKMCRGTNTELAARKLSGMLGSFTMWFEKLDPHNEEQAQIIYDAAMKLREYADKQLKRLPPDETYGILNGDKS